MSPPIPILRKTFGGCVTVIVQLASGSRYIHYRHDLLNLSSYSVLDLTTGAILISFLTFIR